MKSSLWFENNPVLKSKIKIYPNYTKSTNFSISNTIENQTANQWNNKCYYDWSLFETVPARKSKNHFISKRTNQESKQVAGYVKWTVTFFKNLRRYVKPKIMSAKCRTLEDCSICLGPIQISTENTSDRILELKACSHYFHETCLTTWLESKSECPLCRTSIYSWHVHGVYNKLLKFYEFSRK